TAADAIIATDSDGNITLFNSSAVGIFGYSADSIKGSNISALIPGRFQESFRLLMKAVASENQSSRAINERSEICCVKKNGKEFPAEASISKLTQNGELTFMVILNDISPRKEAEEMIHHLAFNDSLTGLPNRTKLHELLDEAIRVARIEEKLVAFLLIDLDRFKEVNDTLGHQRGDLLLQEVASRLKAILRPTDVVARLGGDEFGLVLPVSQGTDATSVAGKVKTALETPYEIEGIPVALDASIGIAIAPDHGTTADSLIQRADVAMYTSKETATGYSIYSTKLDRHSPRRLALMGELRNAIEGGQLRLHYQPQVTLPSLATESVEALVRWPHPIFGLIPPDQFIVPAEQTGLIDPLTRWVLGEALKQCAAWRSRGIEKTMAVNLSVRNLQNRKLANMVGELLENSGLPASLLRLEVTESAIMADPEKGIEVLNQLDRLGVGLSIDDFGTGYSSLTSLKKLPVRELKIDKSFMQNLAEDEENRLIVSSTIKLAHNLGLKVVAEGVEDEATLNRLIELGCDSIQGFHVCKPLAGPDLTDWMEEQSNSDKETAHR
ncbi:MAG TPA: EAL domain-containing protein, partial [Nitrospiria bacterium]